MPISVGSSRSASADVARRLRVAVFFDSASRAAIFAFLAAGVVILLARMALNRGDWALESMALGDARWVWLAVGATLALLVSIWFGFNAVRARAIDARDGAAYLDVASGGHGLLAAASERDGALWSAELERELQSVERGPSLRLQRALTRALVPAAFLVLASLIPLGNGAPSNGAGLSGLVEARADELRTELEALSEVIELDASDTQELEQRLEQIEAGVAHSASESEFELESAYEALDSVEQELKRLAANAARAAERALADLALGAEDALSAPDEASAQLGAALERLADVGLDARLPDSLRAELERLQSELAARAPAEPSDAASAAAAAEAALEFAELSTELAEALAQALQQLAESGALDSAGSMTEIDARLLESLAALDEATLRALIEALENGALNPHAGHDPENCELQPGGT